MLTMLIGRLVARRGVDIQIGEACTDSISPSRRAIRSASSEWSLVTQPTEIFVYGDHVVFRHCRVGLGFGRQTLQPRDRRFSATMFFGDGSDPCSLDFGAAQKLAIAGSFSSSPFIGSCANAI